MSRTTGGDLVREPSVFVQATMDSFLDKKSQVLRTKTRIRCLLYGCMLHEQKDQDVKFRDLRQAQTVRKVTNDPTGTQFEIVLGVKKKTHTYICSSSQECTEWVSALQRCMMLKDSSDMDSNSMFYTGEHSSVEDSSVYTTIEDTGAGASSSSPASESNDVITDKDYYTPYDAVGETVTNRNEYEDVEIRKSSYEFGSQDTQNDHSKGEPVDNVYSDGISEPVYPYATVGKKTTDPVDDLAGLETALADNGLTFGDLPHSLSSEDLSCMRTLKTFLRSNDMYHRSSSLQNSNTDDCLSALKSCLSTLSRPID